MSDTYQAVYDAVRSRIGGADIGGAIESALRCENIGHYAQMVCISAQDTAAAINEAHTTPSAIYRPKIYPDGNQWCALYGDDLQSGVCGFGDSPALAMADFDKSWKTPITARSKP